MRFVKRWTKPVALVVAWVFWMGQAMPVAYAFTNLRQRATRAAGDAGSVLGHDRGWDAVQAVPGLKLQARRLVTDDQLLPKAVSYMMELGDEFFGGEEVPQAVMDDLGVELAQQIALGRLSHVHIELLGKDIRITVTTEAGPMSPSMHRDLVNLVYETLSQAGEADAPGTAGVDPGMTFIAVTPGGATAMAPEAIPGELRGEIDRTMQTHFRPIFDRGEALQFGPGTPSLARQTAAPRGCLRPPGRDTPARFLLCSSHRPPY